MRHEQYSKGIQIFFVKKFLLAIYTMENDDDDKPKWVWCWHQMKNVRNREWGWEKGKKSGEN